MGRRLVVWLCLLALCLTQPLFALPFSVTYSKLTAAGVRVNVVVVDLDDPHVAVVPVMASGFDESAGKFTHEPFSKFIARAKPTAAMNGTFFSKTDWKPVGSVVIDGKLVNNGDLGTAFTLDATNKPKFFKTGASLHERQGSRINWSGVRYGLTCGPTLVWEGKTDVHAEAEGFHDSHVLGGGQRSALGVTASRQLLLVTTEGGATLSQLASAMKALGAHDAINLDGGASSAMYFRGSTLTSPGRELTNVLLVYENKWRAPKEVIAQQSASVPPKGSPDVHVARGKQLALQGKWQEAADEFLRASKLQPDSAAIHRSLGDAYEKLGQVEEAARVYRQASEIYKQKGFFDVAQVLFNHAQKLIIQSKPDAPTPPTDSPKKQETTPVPKEEKPTDEEKKEQVDEGATSPTPSPDSGFLARARLRIQPYLEHRNWMGIITGVILFIGMDIGFALGGLRAGLAVLSLLGSIIAGIAGSPHVTAAAQGRVQKDAETLHFYSFLGLTAVTFAVLCFIINAIRKSQQQEVSWGRRSYGKRTYPWIGALFGLGGTWLFMGTMLWFLSARSEAHSRVRTDIENSRLATCVRDTTANVGVKVGSVLRLQPPPILFTPNIEELPFFAHRVSEPAGNGQASTQPTFDEKGEEEMLKLVNAEREKNKLPPLKMTEQLRRVARGHSEDMVKLKYFSHDSPQGKTPFDRIKALGVTYVTAGENIAQAPTVARAHEGLMNSKGHRENILRSSFTEIGIGIMDAGKMGKMVTQNFIGR